MYIYSYSVYEVLKYLLGYVGTHHATKFNRNVNILFSIQSYISWSYSNP